MSTVEGVLNFTLAPLKFLFWILSLPLRLFAVIVNKMKVYNPEKLTCPGCGFKGDSGTGSKSCRIRLVGVKGSTQEVMLRHTCFRCDASFYTKTFVNSKEWYKTPIPITKEEKAKEILKDGTL